MFRVSRELTEMTQPWRIGSGAGQNSYYEAATVQQRQHHSEEMYQKPGSSTARKKSYQTSLIRCLDFLDRDRVRRRAARVLGRHHRQLEGHSRECTRKNGVTNIKLAGDKVVAARLSSRIDFLRLEIYTKSRQIDWGFSFAYRRTHIRTGSAGSLSIFQQPNGPARVHHASEEELRGIQVFHQQGH
ncbi:uncharacterized protein LOC120432501 [Culex pipiens pallens]|uniref:uncharacterized protein LOC120432501 n=1 Tax=Culex pipiens pallens TaxID=42434 RepID=UPI001952AC2D|nr:uncharacterized protein LOC120432501 [Culex pipiens pallens]XP_052562776.1 uncharacterized protein LOC120432501 [Culex pipiens pallens]XP_052562777.1 uncharacterized protein LOC120432501 [Culex pipiens pallens]XP_052562778.1 uncharacterized protein LOC120432501 [Culex pipiens pallens]